MIYLTQMLGKPVVDATGSEIGTINDIAIATGEIFPRVTSLAFKGPDKTPFMLSWRKWVEDFDGDNVTLNAAAPDIRFSYLQPDEVLLHRDLLNKQIVDTQGKKVVRVNDLKLSESKNQLRLLGAEVGIRGVLRGLHPLLERSVAGVTRAAGHEIGENLIAWNYMDLLDRDLSHVSLSVSHKRLHELHPADVADILEVLSPSQRARVFEHLENTQAADAVAELEDEYQADVIDDLSNLRAASLLGMMDPDDAADIIGGLPYDKAETLLRLMGVKESRAIRSLLGYKEKTAGGIMTPEVTTVTEQMTVAEVIEFLRSEAAEHESIYYIYVVEDDRQLAGVISLRDLIMSSPDVKICDILSRDDLISAHADDDQEDVAETMSKYDLLALPVIDETGRLLGIVTVDDALEVMEEESAEDLALATGRRRTLGVSGLWHWVSRDGWLIVWSGLFLAMATLARVLADEAAAVVLIFIALLLPVVLRVAEDVASHVMARVIEGFEQEPSSLWGRLVRDGLSGLGLGLIVGLVAFGVVEILFATEDGTGATLATSTLVGGVFALSILIVTFAGAVIGIGAERRTLAEKHVSHVAVSVTLMLIAAASFVALSIAVIAAFSGVLGLG